MRDATADRAWAELMDYWADAAGPVYASPATPAMPASPNFRPTNARSVGAELGERLVSEVLEGVRAGRQGVFVSEPEKLRTAIFIRGYALGDFARMAGIAPATLSRALAGQSVAPTTWRLLITTLAGL